MLFSTNKQVAVQHTKTKNIQTANKYKLQIRITNTGPMS